jgi:hypothetical protein
VALAKGAGHPRQHRLQHRTRLHAHHDFHPEHHRVEHQRHPQDAPVARQVDEALRFGGVVSAAIGRCGLFLLMPDWKTPI